MSHVYARADQSAYKIQRLKHPSLHSKPLTVITTCSCSDCRKLRFHLVWIVCVSSGTVQLQHPHQHRTTAKVRTFLLLLRLRASLSSADLHHFLHFNILLAPLPTASNHHNMHVYCFLCGINVSIDPSLSMVLPFHVPDPNALASFQNLLFPISRLWLKFCNKYTLNNPTPNPQPESLGFL